MSDSEFDLITIGAGSGGVRASRHAADFGAKVAVIESQALGGTCVNAGCVPKKLLSYAAHFRDDFEDARGYGWTIGAAQCDWPRLIAAKNLQVARLNALYGELLEAAGTTVIRGQARLVGPHQVAVGDRVYRARHILVATGSRPAIPALSGQQYLITSNEAFHLPVLPPRVLIYGAGYIGVEFASIFNGLGAKTSLVYRTARVLPGFDAELGHRLGAEMAKKGVAQFAGTTIVRVEPAAPDQGLIATLSNGEVIGADCVLAATGRLPNSEGLGLTEQGVLCGPYGAVRVDETYTTNVPSIHAIGDVTDRIQLTPVATAEAMAFASHCFGHRARPVSYANIPTAVFSHPNVASVGLSEDKARAMGHELRIFKQSFLALKQSLSVREEPTFVKLVVDATSDRVLGVHMLGPDAGEVIQGFAVALTCRATKAQLDETLGVHPTVAEEFVTMRSVDR